LDETIGRRTIFFTPNLWVKLAPSTPELQVPARRLNGGVPPAGKSEQGGRLTFELFRRMFRQVSVRALASRVTRRSAPPTN